MKIYTYVNVLENVWNSELSLWLLISIVHYKDYNIWPEMFWEANIFKMSKQLHIE